MKLKDEIYIGALVRFTASYPHSGIVKGNTALVTGRETYFETPDDIWVLTITERPLQELAMTGSSLEVLS